MATKLVYDLTAGRDKARKDFKIAMGHERSARQSAHKALASCYAFAAECFDNPAPFVAMCDDTGIKKSHEDATPFLRVVKLCFGQETPQGWEPISRQLASKYAAVLDFASYKKIPTDGLTKWLAADSVEGRLGRRPQRRLISKVNRSGR